MRILLCDDCRFSLSAFSRLLTKAGHTVNAVGDGRSALRAILKGKIDVLITDYRMPRSCGIEMVTSARLQFGKRVGIIGMSASDDCRDEFLAAGADTFLEKPPDPGALVKLVAQVTPDCTEIA